MKIVLCPDPRCDAGCVTAQKAAAILMDAGAVVWWSPPLPMRGGYRLFPGIPKVTSLRESLPGADALIVIGGDDTLLHTVKAAILMGVSLLGVDVGSSGSLTGLKCGELRLLTRLLEGKFDLERRVTLKVTVNRNGKHIYHRLALNEAVIENRSGSHTVTLSLYDNGWPMWELRGDGVAVSSPIGATEYALSAGRPLVDPTAENMIVTPICPHSLYTRTVVLGGAHTVDISLSGRRNGQAGLSIDGRTALAVKPGDIVNIAISRQRATFIRLNGKQLYQKP